MTSKLSAPLDVRNIRMMPLDTLLAESDFVCICADLNETSYRMIDAKALPKMKPTAYLINVARGKIVDEAALIAALQRGQIAGAALGRL